MVKTVVNRLGGIPAFECSALSGEGVEDVFRKLAETMLAQVPASQDPGPAPVPLEQTKKDGCC